MKLISILAVTLFILGLIALPFSSVAQDRSKNFTKPFDRNITIQCVVYSPDGRYLAAGSGAQDENGEVVIWDAKTHKVHSITDIPKGVPSVAFSPDSTVLAAGSFSQNCYVIDPASGKVRTTLSGHGDAARGVAFSPDGNILAVGSYDNSIRLWDYRGQKVLRNLTGHTKGIYQLAYSPDGQTLASCSLANDYTARLWDTASGKLLRTWKDYGNSGVRGVAYDPLGQWLAIASPNGTMKLRDLKTDKVWGNFMGAGGQWVAVAPDRKTLAAGRIGGKSAQLYTLHSGEGSDADMERIVALIAKWEDNSIEVRETASVEVQKFGLMADALLYKSMKEGPSPESRMRARLAREAIHSPSPSALLEGHWQPILGAAFSPNSEILATGARDGQVILWDLSSNKVHDTLAWPTRSP